MLWKMVKGHQKVTFTTTSGPELVGLLLYECHYSCHVIDIQVIALLIILYDAHDGCIK